jgi:protein-L-isoaspartate O-methyltransferase
VRYDNLKAAVAQVLGFTRARVETERWTAALLSHRVGAGNVVSVDIDAGVSEVAAKNLAAAGFAPQLVVVDGAKGFPDGAPYDRAHGAACHRS